jgi:hypothetical protein
MAQALMLARRVPDWKRGTIPLSVKPSPRQALTVPRDIPDLVQVPQRAAESAPGRRARVAP